MENFDYFAFIGTYTKGNVVNQGLESRGIYILGYNSKNGELNLLNTALEKDNPSFLSISPDGKYLYGSNWGHDSIAIYKVSNEGRKLENIDYQSTLGKTPRNFAIDPKGNFLLAANQDSSDIFTFKINKESGKLDPTGFKIEIPYPVCIKFLKR